MNDFLDEMLEQDEWTAEDLEGMRLAHERKYVSLYNDCYRDYLDKGISPYDLF